METWLKILLISIAAVVLVATICIVIFIILKKKNKATIVEEFPQLILSLGGKENIISVSYKGSRVNVEVNDKKLVDKESLKGEVETIVVSSKKVTMVAGNDKSIKICDYLTKMLDTTE